MVKLTEDRIYYKVIQEYSGITHSCRTHSFLNYDLLQKICLKYSVDEWTEPKIQYSKLFVFSNFEAAKKFAHMYSCTAIYSCYVRNPFRLKGIIPLCSLNLCNVKQMWKNRQNKKKYITHGVIEDLPKCTIGCDAVKLIKKVWNKFGINKE